MKVKAGDNEVVGVTNDPISAGYMAGDVNSQTTEAETRKKCVEFRMEMVRRGRQGNLPECNTYGYGGGYNGGDVYMEDFRNVQPPAPPDPTPQQKSSTDPNRPATKAELDKVEEKTNDLIRLKKAEIQNKQ
jgi:hypothetical protein